MGQWLARQGSRQRLLLPPWATHRPGATAGDAWARAAETRTALPTWDGRRGRQLYQRTSARQGLGLPGQEQLPAREIPRGRRRPELPSDPPSPPQRPRQRRRAGRQPRPSQGQRPGAAAPSLGQQQLPLAARGPGALSGGRRLAPPRPPQQLEARLRPSRSSLQALAFPRPASLAGPRPAGRPAPSAVLRLRPSRRQTRPIRLCPGSARGEETPAHGGGTPPQQRRRQHRARPGPQRQQPCHQQDRACPRRPRRRSTRGLTRASE